MKADMFQQHALVDLAAVDADLARLIYRRAHLPEQQDYEELQGRRREISDTLAVLAIALDDLGAQVAKVDSEVTAVRQREDRDRSLLTAGTVGAKELTEIQHELDTLLRRQSSLEDTEIELMERREELQTQQADARSRVDEIDAQLAAIEQRQGDVVAEIERATIQGEQRRIQLIQAVGDSLLDLYERQRRSGGPGAGLMQGNKCAACRLELDRGELSRIAAAPANEVLRCPECNAILVRA